MVWDSYPLDYRASEVRRILAAVQAGDSVCLVGLSGAGKSNLAGFLAQRAPELSDSERLSFSLIDCNRLPQAAPAALFQSVRAALGDADEAASELDSLQRLLDDRFRENDNLLCLALDRFDAFEDDHQRALAGNLRALRDAHKYRLCYLITTRRPLEADSEMAELFYANTIWLGPLSESDARWSAAAYAARRGETWERKTIDALMELSGRYPSFLRAACEAYADWHVVDVDRLAVHPAVGRRVAEFWSDAPTDEHLKFSGLAGLALLSSTRPAGFDTSALTAKEHALLEHFLAHPQEVCEKHELIVAVWPEDRVYEEGVRDDSLAQLVRRLRKKLEPDASNPRYFQTVPGRGYRYTP